MALHEQQRQAQTSVYSIWQLVQPYSRQKPKSCSIMNGSQYSVVEKCWISSSIKEYDNRLCPPSRYGMMQCSLSNNTLRSSKQYIVLHLSASTQCAQYVLCMQGSTVEDTYLSFTYPDHQNNDIHTYLCIKQKENTLLWIPLDTYLNTLWYQYSHASFQSTTNYTCHFARTC